MQRACWGLIAAQNETGTQKIAPWKLNKERQTREGKLWPTVLDAGMRQEVIALKNRVTITILLQTIHWEISKEDRIRKIKG